MDPLPGLIGPAYDAQTNCGLSDCTIDHVAISPSAKFMLVHYAGDHDRILDVNPTTLALTPHVYPAGTPECSGHSSSNGFVYDVGHSDISYAVFCLKTKRTCERTRYPAEKHTS